MSDSAALYRAKENLRMLETCPTWYDHLSKVEAAMAEHDRIYKIRTAAGWEQGDEGGWYAPCPETGELIREWDWLDLGMAYPEDMQ
tara:strand:- start:1921 stop:2178 length:258 start_codon:yes stop_codon:yes gene_type:complete